jgi:hypothetical protein
LNREGYFRNLGSGTGRGRTYESVTEEEEEQFYILNAQLCFKALKKNHEEMIKGKGNKTEEGDKQKKVVEDGNKNKNEKI